MVGGEDHVGVVEPTAARRRSPARARTPRRSARSSRGTLALISRILSSVSVPGRKQHGPPSALTNRPSHHAEPVRGLLREHRSDLRRSIRDGPAGRSRSRQSTRCSSDSGRIPRVVRVGEAHPAEPVVVGGQRVEPGRSCDRRPSRCGTSSRGIGLCLVSGAPVSPPGSAPSSGAKPSRCSGWCSCEPAPVVLRSARPPNAGDVHRLLGVLEPAPRAGVAALRRVRSPPTVRSDRTPGSKCALPSSAVR